jgi:hypothetical protein
MACNSKSETFDIDRSTLISDMTMAAILDLTTEIEAYERMYPEKSENQVLKLIRSKRWYYVSKTPEFASWRDWFVIMVINGVCENLSFYRIKMADEEYRLVENLIYKTMSEFPCWKSKGGYYRQRIGFRQLVS